MITAETLVAREVHYCVSSLVSTLATCHGDRLGSDMTDAAEQAFELASPIADYESAALDAGCERQGNLWTKETDDGFWVSATTLEEICQNHDIEPYEREVFEHWIVSDWLADHLIKRGEKVDKDFCGLTVWARTTTGQAIASDYVIDDILRELGEA